MGRPLATISVGAVQEAPYIARLLNGGYVGRFATAGAAQRAVDRSCGLGHLRWERENLDGAIEHYVGYERAFWPIDLGDDLLMWLDSNQGIGLTDLSGESRVTTWHSWDRNGNQAAAAASTEDAALLVYHAGPADLDLVGFGYNHPGQMSTDLNVTPPYTLSIVASHEQSPHGGPDVLCSIGTERIEVSGGIWVWNTASGNVSGPAIVNGRLVVITVVHNGLAGELFVNNVSAGVQADVIGSSAVSLSDAVAYWGGYLGSLVIADRRFAAAERGRLVSYQAGRFQVAL